VLLSFVMFVWFDPSASITYISPGLPPSYRENAMCAPSGDQAGV
jgi:hypothetical protein